MLSSTFSIKSKINNVISRSLVFPALKKDMIFEANSRIPDSNKSSPFTINGKKQGINGGIGVLTDTTGQIVDVFHKYNGISNTKANANTDCNNEPIISTKRAIDLMLNNRGYAPIGGLERLNKAFHNRFLSKVPSTNYTQNIGTIATVGGTGGLRLTMSIIRKFSKDRDVIIMLPQRTWPNHIAIINSEFMDNVKVVEYSIPFMDEYQTPTGSHKLGFQDMSYNHYLVEMEEKFLNIACNIDRNKQDVYVLLQDNCHNPTGRPFDTFSILRNCSIYGFTPIMDMAYGGLHTGSFQNELIENIQMLSYASCSQWFLPISFSKNMGLYSERTGMLVYNLHNKSNVEFNLVNDLANISGNVNQTSRTLISNVPRFGQEIVADIFENDELYGKWEEQLKEISTDLGQLRKVMSSYSNMYGIKDYNRMGRGLFTEFNENDDVVNMMSEKMGIVAVKGGCRFNIASLMTKYNYTFPLSQPINTVIHYLYWSIYHLSKWQKLKKEGKIYSLPEQSDFEKIANDVKYVA